MPTPQTGKTVFCTIVSKNYLARARALVGSLKKFHPDATYDVLIVDRIDGFFDPKKENFGVTQIEELPIPEMAAFCFQYNILELNTATKPYYMEVLLKKHQPEKLVYLDPDILALGSLSPMLEKLNAHSIVLTPHTTVPYPNTREQAEVDLLRAGVFNLGFVAVKNDSESIRMLQWWQTRLYMGCRSEMHLGYHVDQKWMDLAPCLFKGVCILREPGYNIATWNFHAHTFTVQNGKYFVDGEPLRFFHFSAFNPLNPGVVSKNQNHYTLETVGNLKDLFLSYSKITKEFGFEETVKWPYAFGIFDNGETIPGALRSLYLKMGKDRARFGNPFRTKQNPSLYTWWKSGVETYSQERLADFIYKSPQDWSYAEVENTLLETDLYDWFRRSNPRPDWNAAKGMKNFIQNWIKYIVLKALSLWIPPLFVKQYILNRVLWAEVQALKNQGGNRLVSLDTMQYAS